MTAEQVRALVAKKYPEAIESPLAQVMDAASALSKLEASDADQVIEAASALPNPKAATADQVAACSPYEVEALISGEWRTYGCNTIADLEAIQQVFAAACVPYHY